MMFRPWASAAFIVLSLAVPGRAESNRIDALIRQMGSEAFVLRERAMVELEALGPSALEPLRKASKSTDAEMARRAAELVRRFEERVLVEQAQAPKKLRLQVEDMGALDAVAELARRSGYAVEVGGDRNAIAARKVTLDTGDVTFWEAIDRLGAKAGIVLPASPTTITNTSAAVQMNLMRGGRVRGVRVGPVAPSAAQEHIELMPGAAPRHLSYAGACRVELRPGSSGRVVLDAAAEPRLLSFSVIGPPVIDKALDDEGRALTVQEDGVPALTAAISTNAGTVYANSALPRPQRQVLLRLEPPTKKLRELSGALPVRVMIPNELLASVDVQEVLTNGSATAVSKCGGSMQVQSFEKAGDNQYRLTFLLENLGPNPFAQQLMLNGNIVIQGNVAMVGGALNGTTLPTLGLPDLIDAEGRKYQVAEIPSQSTRMGNNQLVRQLTVVYRAQAGQDVPQRLVYYGTRFLTMPVAFRFQDVELQ